MKIAILSRKESLYSTTRLKEAAIARGHDVAVIDYLRCYMDITSEKPSIYYDGEKLPAFDAIIPRIAPRRTFYGTSVVRQFETSGIYSVNSSLAITRSRDKLRSLQLMSRAGIGLPRTGFANNPKDIENLIKMVGGTPLIIKLIEGTQGVGVVLAETKKAAESLMQAFMGINANIIVQEFIKESKGSDIRCFVIGDKVVASIVRQAEAGEFRSNLHRGGTAQAIKITKEERQAAVKAAQVMGLQVAGVDLLRSDDVPRLMEVNSSPGLEGIEAATSKDIASLVIEHIEKHAKPISKKSRFQG